MCEVCAIFGAGEHWSDFGRLRNEKFPFADIQVYRSERIRRLALLAKILAPLGLSVEDWDGEAALLVDRSEEHTSELQSLMRISYAVFCLKKKSTITQRAQH